MPYCLKACESPCPENGERQDTPAWVIEAMRLGYLSRNDCRQGYRFISVINLPCWSGWAYLTAVGAVRANLERPSDASIRLQEHFAKFIRETRKPAGNRRRLRKAGNRGTYHILGTMQMHNRASGTTLEYLRVQRERETQVTLFPCQSAADWYFDGDEPVPGTATPPDSLGFYESIGCLLSDQERALSPNAGTTAIQDILLVGPELAEQRFLRNINNCELCAAGRKASIKSAINADTWRRQGTAHLVSFTKPNQRDASEAIRLAGSSAQLAIFDGIAGFLRFAERIPQCNCVIVVNLADTPGHLQGLCSKLAQMQPDIPVQPEGISEEHFNISLPDGVTGFRFWCRTEHGQGL